MMPDSSRIQEQWPQQVDRRTNLICGERTVLETIDTISVQDPKSVWARYPASSEDFASGVYQTVTFSAFAGAIDALAWHLDTRLSITSERDTMVYVGPSDVRYFILACAACKCNSKVNFS